MDILEILYSREFKSINYNVRKVKIDEKKILFLGPRGSGKSTIIFDHLALKTKGSFLYIDLNDFRLKDLNIVKDLKLFLKKNHISLLILEHFDFSFDIPECDEVIVTVDKKCDITGFTKVEIFPLDFEEFISFDKRDLNLEATFNSYATYGTLLAMNDQYKGNFTKIYQNYLSTIYTTNDLEMAMLKIFSSHQGRAISMYELFNVLKLNYKISKDRFYEFSKQLQDRYILFLVAKFGSKRSTKKIYLIDFTIRNALSFDKDFIKRFENIVFLELMKREKDIFYTDAIDFYLPDEQKAIIIIPFLPIELIKRKIDRLSKHFIKQEIKTVQVITMGEQEEFKQNGITYELLPFWSFATSL